MSNIQETKNLNRWGIVYVPMAGARKKHRRWHQIKEYLEMKKVQYDYIQSEVEIKRSRKGKGTITITFNSDSDFQRIISLIKK